MSTRIRLRRMGSNKRPFYRVVVADQRSPRDGRFIEIIGRYHPLSDPSVIEIDEARALHWLTVGAQPSDQVRTLMSKVGVWEKFLAERPGAAIATPPRDERPARPKLSKKAQAKAEAEREDEAPSGEAPPAAEALGAPEDEASEPGAHEAEAPGDAETEVATPESDGATDEGSGSQPPSAEEPSGD